MDFIINIISAVFCIILFGSSIIFVWILIFRPKWIGLYHYHPYNVEGWARITPWVTIGVFFSLLAILGIGLDKVLFFIPESWAVGYGEDAGSVKGSLVTILAGIGTFFIYSTILKHYLKNFRLKYCDRKSQRKICEETEGLMNKIMRPPVIISVIMLLLAIFPFPYGYYTLLRLVVCGTAIYLTWFAKFINRMGWMWCMGFITLLFNPIIPIRLDRVTWNVIDLAVAVVFIVGVIKLKENKKDRS